MIYSAFESSVTGTFGSYEIGNNGDFNNPYEGLVPLSFQFICPPMVSGDSFDFLSALNLLDLSPTYRGPSLPGFRVEGILRRVVFDLGIRSFEPLESLGGSLGKYTGFPPRSPFGSISESLGGYLREHQYLQYLPQFLGTKITLLEAPAWALNDPQQPGETLRFGVFSSNAIQPPRSNTLDTVNIFSELSYFPETELGRSLTPEAFPFVLEGTGLVDYLIQHSWVPSGSSRRFRIQVLRARWYTDLFGPDPFLLRGPPDVVEL